jgi:hypothetical protein
MLRKKLFLQGGMLKFTYRGRFLTIKRHLKNNCIENSKGECMLLCNLHIQDFLYVEKK